MNFLLFVDPGGFVLKTPAGRDGRFPSIKAAIRFIEAMPGTSGEKLIVHSSAGQPSLELVIGR